MPSVIWRSSKPDVATVDSDGILTGKSKGSTEITATFDGKDNTVTVNVVERQVAATGITLTMPNTTLQPQGKTNITATIAPPNATQKALQWSSSNTSVATVNQNGQVTAVAQGTTEIKAQLKDNANVFSTATITVSQQ